MIGYHFYQHVYWDELGEAYIDESISTFSSSVSSMYSRKVEPDLSADDCDISSASANFDWDANFDRSHCKKPGMGLRVANVWREIIKHVKLTATLKTKYLNSHPVQLGLIAYFLYVSHMQYILLVLKENKRKNYNYGNVTSSPK